MYCVINKPKTWKATDTGNNCSWGWYLLFFHGYHSLTSHFSKFIWGKLKKVYRNIFLPFLEKWRKSNSMDIVNNSFAHPKSIGSWNINMTSSVYNRITLAAFFFLLMILKQKNWQFPLRVQQPQLPEHFILLKSIYQENNGILSAFPTFHFAVNHIRVKELIVFSMLSFAVSIKCRSLTYTNNFY